MKRNAFLLVILILICNCAPNDLSKKYPANVEEKINQVENNLAGWVQTGTNDRWNLTKRMKQYGINGVSIAVVHNYKIEWARGYGFADISEKRPVTEATLFQAASISKSLNSLGVLKLVQEKKLDPDADINNYLVSWKFPYKELVNVDKSVLEKYTCKYDFNGTQITITMSDTGLSVNPFGNVRWQLYFTSDSDFFIRESRGMAKFRTGKDSKVKGFLSDGQLMKKIQ